MIKLSLALLVSLSAISHGFVRGDTTLPNASLANSSFANISYANRNDLIVDWLEANMTDAMWVMDDNRIQLLIEHSMSHPFIDFSLVFNQDHELSHAGLTLEILQQGTNAHFRRERPIYYNGYFLGTLVVSDRQDSHLPLIENAYQELNDLSGLLAISFSELQWQFNSGGINKLILWALNRQLIDTEALVIEGIEVYDENNRLITGIKTISIGEEKLRVRHYDKAVESIRHLRKSLSKKLHYEGNYLGRLEIYITKNK